MRPNSCGNRHCPTCQGKNRVEWVEARMQELLPVSYFHVVFTLPDTIYPFCLYNQRVVYDLLFRSAAETLKTFGRDPQWLGADKMGFFGVLHTWGQTLSCHPHVHVVVPAGGVDANGEWVWPNLHRAPIPLSGACAGQGVSGQIHRRVETGVCHGRPSVPRRPGEAGRGERI